MIDVVDRFVNLEIGDNSTKVTASLRVGHGPLLGRVTVMASGGIAQFTNLANGNAEMLRQFTVDWLDCYAEICSRHGPAFD